MSEDRFDKEAVTWDDDPERVERAATIAQRITERVELHAGMRVMDFGCGTGLLGFNLLPHVARVTFVDTSREMRAQVEKKLADAPLGRGEVVDGEELRDGSYDLVVSLMALHHVPDTAAALDRMTRYLAPRGWLGLVDLDREDGSFHGHDDESVHRGFDRNELCERLSSLGLSEINASTVYQVQKTVDDHQHSFPLFLITARMG